MSQYQYVSLPKIASRTLGKVGREQQISICAMAFIMYKKIVAFKRSFLNTRDGGFWVSFALVAQPRVVPETCRY
jgi:hypothetical protein